MLDQKQRISHAAYYFTINIRKYSNYYVMENMFLKNKKPITLQGKKIVPVENAKELDWPNVPIHNLISKQLSKYLKKGHRISHAVIWLIKDHIHSNVGYFGISFCSVDDRFDLKEGLRIAKKRAVDKAKIDLGWKYCIDNGLFSGTKKARNKKKAGANDRTKSNE